MPSSAPDSLGLAKLGLACIANIVSFIPYQTWGGRRVRKAASTVQLGWGVRLAHCGRTTFDAVKRAHIDHIRALGDPARWRHPLFYERSSGLPPYRLDQAIHIITRIRPTSPRGTQWGLRTSRMGTALSITRDRCQYQHHSERRSLVIQDSNFESRQGFNGRP
jgi:hypothetical protein